MYSTPEQHAANPPSTWRVFKSNYGRRWCLADSSGTVIGIYDTKRAALADLESGPAATLWEKERRWYAGESIPGWNPYVRP
jgi:hypothetical protein